MGPVHFHHTVANILERLISINFMNAVRLMRSYPTDAMDYNLGKTGFLSALPYLAMGILLLVFGYLADLFQIKGYLTTTQVRRYFNCLGFLVQAVFMLLAAYLLHPVWSLVSIILAVGLGALAWCGFAVNPLDIAPNYASIIFGIQNTVGTLPGIISPTLTGYLVQHKVQAYFDGKNALFKKKCFCHRPLKNGVWCSI